MAGYKNALIYWGAELLYFLKLGNDNVEKKIQDLISYKNTDYIGGTKKHVKFGAKPHH